MDRMLKTGGIILIGILVIGAICLFSIFGGLGNLFGGSSEGVSEREGTLGQLYTATEVDRNGCPIDNTSQFYRDEIIYVGVTQSDIPAGTEMFVRLYHAGNPVEDTQEIQADRDMNTCVWFEFTPQDSAGFDPGDYQAELIVNGNPIDQISFVVGNESAGGGLPQTGGSIELGQVVTTTRVDGDGCPTDSVEEFYPDETIYVSTTPSFIPAGTEMFARLIYEGQVIEDTQPIYADQDMETCVWFSFEGDSFGGLEPGQYEVELYVNGNRAENLPLIIR